MEAHAQTSVKGVIFDLGRVLIDYDVMQTCRNLSAYAGMSHDELHATVFMGDGLSKYRIPYEAGHIDCRTFFGHLCEHARLEGLEFEEFEKHWPDVIGPPEGMHELIGRMRPEIKRGILSNIDPLNWGVASELAIVKQHFNPQHCVVSWMERTRKPEPEIYYRAARRIGVEPEEILYLDDRPENVVAARTCGFVAEQYNCLEQPVAQLEHLLRKHDALR